ncbi:serine hydrolase [candidate division KSB1 bacterium]|nr:serine hydrolase [candidate division KSB1 bacterium]
MYDGYIIASWGEIEYKYLVHSIRKSYLSAMYGIHVDLGNIDLNKTLADLNIDDTPNPLTETEKHAKISDLLKARSGIYLPAAAESPQTRDGKPPHGSQNPGEYWVYNNWDFNALGTIFEQETNTKSFEEYEKRIAGP